MRFAEKMLLNAKFYGLVAGIRHDGKGNRCAIGLVEENVNHRSFGGWADTLAEELYPWVRADARYPCEHYSPAALNNITGVIAHLFNEHVMQAQIFYLSASPWTLEKLADWIDSIDPTPREVPTEEVKACVHDPLGIFNHPCPFCPAEPETVDA